MLAIAGSDSGGGAGIQADLKAFARCGVHGMTAITAVTAQNTLGVSAIHALPAEIVLAQVRAILADIRVDAVKVGMLGTAEVTLAVARALDELPADTPVVVDPVMVAESGARLLEDDAQRALIAEIVPRASVLTPNLPEARALAGVTPDDGAGEAREAETLVRAVLALGPRCVVLTGGHRAEAVDLFLDGAGDGRVVSIRGRASRRRRGARLRVHALVRARRAARARQLAARRRARRSRARRRRGRKRLARRGRTGRDRWTSLT